MVWGKCQREAERIKKGMAVNRTLNTISKFGVGCCCSNMNNCLPVFCFSDETCETKHKSVIALGCKLRRCVIKKRLEKKVRVTRLTRRGIFLV